MKRIVYRKTHGPVCEMNPSCKYEYTNQIYEDGKWKFTNRFIGKFGARPIVWYYSIECAEQYAPEDNEISEMVEWDEIDEEGFKDVCSLPFKL